MDNVIFSGSSDGNWYNLFISNTALFQSLLSELHSDVGAYLVPVALFMYSSGSSCLCWSVFLQSFEAVQSIRIFNNFRIALISLEQLSSLFSCFCNVMQILGKPVLTVKFVLTGSTVFKLAFSSPFEVPQRKTQSGCFDLDSSLLQLKCLSARRYVLFTRNFELFL